MTTELDSETRGLLLERLAPDYILYDFFRANFDQLVSAYGKQEMERDVASLSRETNIKKIQCNFIPNDDQLLSGSSDPICQGFARSPNNFIDRFREKQRYLIEDALLSDEGLKPRAWVPHEGGAVPVEQELTFEKWTQLLKGGLWVLDKSKNPDFKEFKWSDPR